MIMIAVQSLMFNVFSDLYNYEHKISGSTKNDFDIEIVPVIECV